MEKLTIKPWQVMQAHENGAEIEMDLELAWLTETDPTWNWNDYNFRIANLTSDGMRLDELVEKFQDEVDLKTKLTANCGSMFFPCVVTKTSDLIVFLCEHPECIYQVKVKQEKKLRPWTMAEFEKHRDEWFVSKSGSKRKVIHFNDNTLIPAWYEASITYKEFMESFNREDGSPCGVIE